jgi:hypothetical protein
MSTASEDVYAITDRGTNELKGGATTLTAHDLEVLVLVDGRRNGSAIASLAKAADASQVEAVLRKLVAGGFIRTAQPTPNEGFDYFFSSAPSASEPSGEAMRRAAQEAASGAAALRQNGYYVSIARRAKATTHAGRPQAHGAGDRGRAARRDIHEGGGRDRGTCRSHGRPIARRSSRSFARRRSRTSSSST